MKTFQKIRERVFALERATIALASVELGDVEGHEFHGNQYTYKVGYSEDHEAMKNADYKYTNVKVRAKDETEANLLAASMVGHKGIPTSTELISTQVQARLAGHGNATSLKPGDVIVDASNMARPEHPGEFEHLHGATIHEAKEGVGGSGKLTYTDRNGYTKSSEFQGGTTITVERPAKDPDLEKLAREGDSDG